MSKMYENGIGRVSLRIILPVTTSAIVVAKNTQKRSRYISDRADFHIYEPWAY